MESRVSYPAMDTETTHQNRKVSAMKTVLPAEIRALGAILLLDLLLGLWLAVHTRGAITAFLAPQVPVMGLGALCWGFLPDEPKKAFGQWLSRWLATPFVYSSVIVIGACGFVASLFISTVIIESVDPSISTSLYLVRGDEREAIDKKNDPRVEILRLNRLTTPQRSHLLMTPLGQQVWVYSSTRVSAATPRVLPWIPTQLQYPDDFEPLVAIDLLPNINLIPKLYHGDVKFRLWNEENGQRIIAEGNLHEGSTRVAFTRPSAISPETIGRWRSSLEETSRDPTFVGPMLATWENWEWLEARYPLRINDELYYELRDGSDESILAGKLTLTDVVTLLDLSV